MEFTCVARCTVVPRAQPGLSYGSRSGAASTTGAASSVSTCAKSKAIAPKLASSLDYRLVLKKEGNSHADEWAQWVASRARIDPELRQVRKAKALVLSQWASWVARVGPR
eukprot:1665844-Pyramimonas_sp.AAC.1